ncbi:hypothetical protein JN11_01074 [Mucilaginibacter frigoritolerans]|uniref:Uncharacterized protein n=1 Tax=Mucilaginibacter frigoritolerans TaxID=652788 RepID=A0A562UCJ5_9SPHI|nr:hypothetical protein [Mucilaginibacter frigoritolerans]TWJ03528.1 hypothetical protein JN11_01074 [Mucilaginibacter frigoritolerans]
MDAKFITLPALIILEKIICFIIGYLIIRLGYNLIVSGIKGEFKFSSDYKGFRGALKSSSPGLLFVLLGAVLIAFTLFSKKTFEYSGGAINNNGYSQSSTEYKDNIDSLSNPEPAKTLKYDTSKERIIIYKRKKE